MPRTSAVMSIGVIAIGSTRPLAPSSRPTQSRRVDVVAEQLPEPDDEQVPDDVAPHLAITLEPVLEHARPGVTPLVVTAQRGQRHPQVTRREYAELAPESSRRAAVVGHRHDGRELVDGQVVDEHPQRGERRVEAVTTAERDHRLRAVVRPVRARRHHSRPRSRWRARAT